MQHQDSSKEDRFFLDGKGNKDQALYLHILIWKMRDPRARGLREMRINDVNKEADDREKRNE